MVAPVSMPQYRSPLAFALTGDREYAPMKPEVIAPQGPSTKLVAPNTTTSNFSSSAFMNGQSPFADTLVSLGTKTTAVGHPFFEE